MSNPPTPPRLVIHHQDGDAYYPLRRPNVVLGRLETADVVLDDPTVSRIHARLVHLEGAHHLMDLSSRTGTKVNGEPVDDYGMLLKDGDAILVGTVKLTYQATAAR